MVEEFLRGQISVSAQFFVDSRQIRSPVTDPMSSSPVFKVWSSVLLLNSQNFEQFIQGHEIFRTLYKVVLFAKLSDDELKDGVSRFHYLAHHFTHRFALNVEFRVLFAIYNLDNESYPNSLPATTSRSPIAKLIVLKSFNDKVREFGGELDAYNFRNNCSIFIIESIKSFQRPKKSIKKEVDSWYKCIGMNDVAYYTEKPTFVANSLEKIENQEEAGQKFGKKHSRGPSGI